MYVVTLLLLALTVAALTFFKIYGLLIVIDAVSIAGTKSLLEPDDETPGLSRILGSAMVFLACGIPLHLATNLLIWFASMIPAAILSVPVIKYLCRTNWRHAGVIAAVTIVVHITVLLTLNYFGFELAFKLPGDGVW